jgi:predicted RNase H-like HicB family nuclease
MYPDGEAVSAEILELKGVVSWGRDLEHAFAMVTEAAECIVGACATSATDSIARLAEDNGLTVYGRPPRTYRPAAIPSHLLKKPGLILRPVSIDIEAASRD